MPSLATETHSRCRPRSGNDGRQNSRAVLGLGASVLAAISAAPDPVQPPPSVRPVLLSALDTRQRRIVDECAPRDGKDSTATSSVRPRLVLACGQPATGRTEAALHAIANAVSLGRRVVYVSSSASALHAVQKRCELHAAMPPGNWCAAVMWRWLRSIEWLVD